MNTYRNMAAVIKAPLEAGDNIPNIAKTETNSNKNVKKIQIYPELGMIQS